MANFFDMSGLTPEQRAEYEYLGYTHQPAVSALTAPTFTGGYSHPPFVNVDQLKSGYVYPPLITAGELNAPSDKSFGDYGLQMGQAYEAGLQAQADANDTSGQMPEFGSPEYQKMMGHDAMANSKTLPKFNPTSGADWMRGIGLFAKGAILGAPKQAGPAPANPQSQSGGNVSKDSTFNQGDYWGWLFNS